MRSRAQIKSHPIHPMLIAFPIGLWVTGFIFDVLGIWTGQNRLWSAGFYAIVAGCIGAVLAAVPGVIDLFSVVPPNSSARQRGLIHGGLNTLVLLMFAYVAIHRGGPYEAPDRTSIFVSLVAVMLLGISGWLGGTLVYRNQIGVDRRFANANKFKERTIESFDRPACNQGELGEGQLMLLHVGGERLALGRCPDGVFAISDHCTHKGGPLSDGAVIGCAVQCPWHGSQFDVRTGRVIAGPATYQVKTYDVEVRAGEVYVKPKTSATEPRPNTDEPKVA
jgi:uncharacterized membrane protein/nitrite reductase/ring-hydroxylating ferredoxin subunit